MTERRRRETDNQPGKINEYSEEANDDQDILDYPMDDHPDRAYYKNGYQPSTEYPFPEEYLRGTDVWSEPPERYEEYQQDEYAQKPPHETYGMRMNRATPSWQWTEKQEEEKQAWEKKDRKGKKEDASAVRKKSKFRVCTNCGTTTTPAWRRSTSNKILLCNACGLYQRLHGSDRPFSVTPEGKTKAIKNNIEKGVCRGCGVSQTPLWKRGHNNEWLCSSCGLLYTRRGRGEEYRQDWPEYGQEVPWQYGEEYHSYPEWKQREEEAEIQYPYEDKDQGGDYFTDDRFRGYSGYYQEKQ